MPTLSLAICSPALAAQPPQARLKITTSQNHSRGSGQAQPVTEEAAVVGQQEEELHRRSGAEPAGSEVRLPAA